MKERTALVIALVLVPIAAFGLRYGSRVLVEWLYRIAPEGRFKRLLARDRASRRRRG
jgi:hypothetical protein